MFRKRNERVDAEHVREDAGAEVDGRRGDRARGLARGVSTLIGAGAAGVLLWLATQVDGDATNGYWALYGLLAAAGLALALSQLLGGWTKWGWPRISGSVFLLGFLPALIVGGWLLLGHQPDDNWFRAQVLDWSNDIGVEGLLVDLREYVPVIGFGLGLLFGFTFDTTGPRVREQPVVERRRPDAESAPVEDRADADEPLAAERRTATPSPTEDEAEPSTGRRWFGRRGDKTADSEHVAADSRKTD